MLPGSVYDLFHSLFPFLPHLVCQSQCCEKIQCERSSGGERREDGVKVVEDKVESWAIEQGSDILTKREEKRGIKAVIYRQTGFLVHLPLRKNKRGIMYRTCGDFCLSESDSRYGGGGGGSDLWSNSLRFAIIIIFPPEEEYEQGKMKEGGRERVNAGSSRDDQQGWR